MRKGVYTLRSNKKNTDTDQKRQQTVIRADEREGKSRKFQIYIYVYTHKMEAEGNEIKGRWRQV